MTKRHQIYFLQRSDGLIKIGTTSDFPSRLAQLATGHGMLGVVRLINGDVRRERVLHNKFKRFHEYGEWFRPEKGALQKLIDDLPDGDEVISTQSAIKAEWADGEAAFMEAARGKLEAMLKVRMDRTGLKAQKALAAITEDYGFSGWFLRYLRKPTSVTISAFGFKRLGEAYRAELETALGFWRNEIDRLQATGDHEELLAIGDRIAAVAEELAVRIAERKSRRA